MRQEVQGEDRVNDMEELSEILTDGRQGPPNDPDRDGCGPAAMRYLAFLIAVAATISFLVFAASGFRQ